MDSCGAERTPGEELQETADSFQAGNRRIRLESIIHESLLKGGDFFWEEGRGEKGEVFFFFNLEVFLISFIEIRNTFIFMFLKLTHTKFDVYKTAGELVIECYQLMSLLPSDEKFNLVSQIKRAALSVKLNIAEGASRKSVTERRRFYEIARGSVVELDSAFDVCIALKFLDIKVVNRVDKLVNSCYAMLSKLTGM